MKRLFAALKIHPDAGFLSGYRGLQAALRSESIKWVEEQNIHITLKFFGETDEKSIPAIGSVLSECAGRTPVFSLALSGLGLFGSTYAPRVIWTGIEPYEHVAGLMKEVHTSLAAIGFEPDRQNLVPHLTLGRIRSLNDRIRFQQTLDRFKPIRSETLEIGEIILFESILRREGPEYIALKWLPLKKELP